MASSGDPAARRGEVWFADVPGKKRPVLVLSRDPMGRLLHAVICAPITSRKRGLATEVVLGPEAGLAPESVANFDNTFLLSRRLLVLGLSDRWRTEGIGPARLSVAAAVHAPTLFLRRGLRSGGIAPRETFTRFTWTLAGERGQKPR